MGERTGLEQHPIRKVWDLAMDPDGNAGIAADGDDPFGQLVKPPPLILRCKIVLLGDSASGKTSLAQVFQGGAQNFPKNYVMTIGIVLLVKKVTIPDTNVVV